MVDDFMHIFVREYLNNVNAQVCFKIALIEDKAYALKEKKNIKFISLAKVYTIPSSSMSFLTRSNA